MELSRGINNIKKPRMLKAGGVAATLGPFLPRVLAIPSQVVAVLLRQNDGSHLTAQHRWFADPQNWKLPIW